MCRATVWLSSSSWLWCRGSNVFFLSPPSARARQRGSCSYATSRSLPAASLPPTLQLKGGSALELSRATHEPRTSHALQYVMGAYSVRLALRDTLQCRPHNISAFGPVWS
jgi:hypothetical protein